MKTKTILNLEFVRVDKKGFFYSVIDSRDVKHLKTLTKSKAISKAEEVQDKIDFDLAFGEI